MSAQVHLLLLASTLLAAAGQILFKIGASGRDAFASFLNFWILSGLVAYGFSTVIWIYALSKARLTVVYPFTALTFALVYLFGTFVLREPISTAAIIGVVLVLAGLFLISSA